MSDKNPNSQDKDARPEDQIDTANASGLEEDQSTLEDAAVEALNQAEEASAEKELSVEETQAAEIADLKEKLLRAMAETENIRRRSEKEKEDAHNYAITKFARDMLSVSDNLRRALESVPAESREDEAVKTLLTGVEMTDAELISTFGKHKIEPVEAEGQKFDPNFHQAMFEIENPEVEPGTVLQVVQSGYVISGRLLRPALVGVAKGGQKKAVKVDQSA
ncbi:nucleotide exchange factor GrpE [Sneathiella aquimaris]|uniref:nucleotide exchange factor GrpE n=1 Tax=Sneathiella aquimaris TaxID=2599305 RepID=UPI001469C4EA|nr:nucleotide exchange factor GrpE [Sneathiella aquimaris]